MRDFFEETRIDSGPVVVSHAMPRAQSTALGIFVDVGSRDETGAQAGAAHALEHMLFKGTSRFDVHTLSRKLDRLGGNANAFTGREHTCLHIHVLHEDWPEALDLITGMICDSTLPEEEWAREREVIFAEMSMIDDAPEEWIADRHLEALFPDQAVGRPTLGSRAALASMCRDDLVAFRDRFYRPPRLIVAAAGRVDHGALVAEVAARRWPEPGEGVPRPSARRAPRVHLLPRETEQAHFALSYPGIAAAAGERPLMWLANQMLGGSMSSRLFREVREKRGLAYSIGSGTVSLSDAGVWMVGGATDPARLSDCVDTVERTLAEFADTLDAAELAEAKRQLEVQLRMGVDSAEGMMLYLGSRLDEPAPLSPLAWAEAVRRVELEELRHFARGMLAAAPAWSVAAPRGALDAVAGRLDCDAQAV